MLAGRRGDFRTRKRVGLGWIALGRWRYFVVFIIDGMVLVYMDRSDSVDGEASPKDARTRFRTGLRGSSGAKLGTNTQKTHNANQMANNV